MSRYDYEVLKDSPSVYYPMWHDDAKFRDDFNRADANLLGANWQNVFTVDNAYRITSNQAAALATADRMTLVHPSYKFADDQYAQANLATDSTTYQAGPGFFLRGSGQALETGPDTTSEGYRVVFAHSTPACAVGHFRAGVWQGVIGSLSFTWADGDLLRAEIRGNRISVWKNGVQQGSDIVDTGFRTASGQPGLGFSTPATTATADNFECGSLTPFTGDFIPLDISGNGLHMDDYFLKPSPGYQRLIRGAKSSVSFNKDRQKQLNVYQLDVETYQRNADGQPQVGDTFTIECWLSRREFTNTTDIGIVVMENEYAMFLYQHKIALTKSNVGFVAQANTAFTDSTIHHCVVKKNGATYSILIDGVPVSFTDFGNMTFGNTGSHLRIGSEYGTSGNYFNGLISNVAVYPTYLQDSRIAEHYAAGLDKTTAYYSKRMAA